MPLAFTQEDFLVSILYWKASGPIGPTVLPSYLFHMGTPNPDVLSLILPVAGNPLERNIYI